MAEAEDEAVGLLEDPARAPRRASRTRVLERRAGGPSAAARRRPRVARPAVRVGPLGARAGPTGRRLGAARTRGRAIGRDDVGRGPRRRSRAAGAHALRLPRSTTTVGEWTRDAAAGPFWRRARARSAAASVYAVDGSAYFSRPGPRVVDGIALLAELFDPEGVRRSMVADRRAGPRSDVPARRMPFRADVRLPVVRPRAHVREPRRPRGLGAAVPRLRGPGR